MKNNGWALQYASEGLKANKVIVLAAVKRNRNALEDASEDLRGDSEVVMAAVVQDGESLRLVIGF